MPHPRPGLCLFPAAPPFSPQTPPSPGGCQPAPIPSCPMYLNSEPSLGCLEPSHPSSPHPTSLEQMGLGA